MRAGPVSIAARLVLVSVMRTAAATALGGTTALYPRGTVQATNQYPVRPLRALAGVAWERRVRFRDFGAMALGGNVVVTGNITGEGGTFAFDASTGKPLWSVPGQVKGGPAVDGEAAYVVNDARSDQYRLSSRALATGKRRWALEAATGKELWRFQAKPETYSHGGECVEAPAVASDTAVTTASNIVYALDARTGALRWTQEIRRMVEGRNRRRPLSEPVIAGGTVYSYFPEGIAGWTLASGQPAFELMGAFREPQYRHRMAAAGGVLFFVASLEEPAGGSSRQVFRYAFDLQCKQVLWKHRVNRPSPHQPIAN